MVTWEHMMCGKQTKFPPGKNPNGPPETPCPKCGVALGGWAPA